MLFKKNYKYFTCLMSMSNNHHGQVRNITYKPATKPGKKKMTSAMQGHHLMSNVKSVTNIKMSVVLHESD